MSDLLTKKDKFILDENNNVIPANLMEWAEWLENAGQKKIVQQDYIDDNFISTVFLGLDHGFGMSSEPLIFETMVFSGNPGKDIYCDRSTTWKEAVKGHKRAIQWVKDGCKHEDDTVSCE